MSCDFEEGGCYWSSHRNVTVSCSFPTFCLQSTCWCQHSAASAAVQWETGGCPGYLRDLLPSFHLPSVDSEEGMCREESVAPPFLIGSLRLGRCPGDHACLTIPMYNRVPFCCFNLAVAHIQCNWSTYSILETVRQVVVMPRASALESLPPAIVLCQPLGTWVCDTLLQESVLCS